MLYCFSMINHAPSFQRWETTIDRAIDSDKKILEAFGSVYVGWRNHLETAGFLLLLIV